MHNMASSIRGYALFCTAIEDLLEIAKSVPKDGLPEHFDLISKDCHSLQRLVSDATLYLTAFELRTAQEVHIPQCSCIVMVSNVLMALFWPFSKFVSYRPKLLLPKTSCFQRRNFPSSLIQRNHHQLNPAPTL